MACFRIFQRVEQHRTAQEMNKRNIKRKRCNLLFTKSFKTTRMENQRGQKHKERTDPYTTRLDAVAL